MTIPENKRNEAQVELYDNEVERITIYAMKTYRTMNDKQCEHRSSHSEWSKHLSKHVKFGNNTVDSTTIFLHNLLMFEKGYKINEQDTLENLDAVLIGEVQSWYQVNKINWHNLENFIQEFKRVYLNKKYLEVIHNKIKFCNQKKNQEIHSFIIEIRQLFEKLEPLPSLKWQLKKVYKNIRLEYKIYITKNSFGNFTELEIVGSEWEAEMEKSRIKEQQIKIMENDGNDRYYTKARK